MIEIISRGSVTEDKVRKFSEYEQAGVREYWLIDPRRHRQQANFYILREDGRFYPAEVDNQGIYHSAMLPGFWLAVDWLWQEELPEPQLALAEIMLSMRGLDPKVKEIYWGLYKLLGGSSDCSFSS
ncbi:MAG: Uma2 family endonuclease [Anaerolineales bacterium]